MGDEILPAEAPAEHLLNEPGAYDLPEPAYHLDPLRHLGGSLSSTTARKLLAPSCPALARWTVDNPEFKDAYDLGSVTHRLILGSGCDIVEVPASSWSTNAAKDARTAARGQGKVALLTKDLARAQAMRDAVHADPLARAVLTMPGAPERTLAWREDVDGEPVWCRAMLDRWPDPTAFGGASPVAVDLKTTDSVSDEHLTKTIWQYGYAQQRDFYVRGYTAVHGVVPAFLFVFVQKDPPHLVRVVDLDIELERIGRERNDQALRIWQACRESGEWPGYGEDIALIGAPRWARTREDYS